ncbi:MAG: amidohydrolase, partial [Acidimicrobiia bacterium]|nr:amidohydrolase [Acidimicrobiia bacterium]
MTDLPDSEGLPRWYHDAVTLRREIHMHPELRFEEHHTARVLSERLTELGYTVKTGVGGTGVVATMKRGEGANVVLRADMDALPLTEVGDHEYRSQIDGVMHACGHDVHTAVVTAAARLLGEDDVWAGTVTILMQPAEEIPYGEKSGARAVIESGAIDFTDATVLGLHCWPWLPIGTIGIDPTVAMASKDAFRIVMRGATTHAASPVDGRDAILAMSDLVST